MALTGVASADITTITPLSGGTWTLDPSTQIFLNDGVLSAGTYLHWTVGTATYELSSTMGCISASDTLSFSFDATNNGTGNSILTLALIGSSNAIVAGHGSYDKPGDAVQVALTTNTTANGYGFAATNADDDIELTAAATLAGAMPTGGVTTTISGVIAWDGDSYALTLSSSAITDTLTYDLGLTSIEVSKLMVTLEGGDNGNDGADWDKTPTMSNLSVTGKVIPEPTTATLSLLALAGLAARRRRK